MNQRQSDADRKQAGIRRAQAEQARQGQSPTPTQQGQTPAQASSPPAPQQSQPDQQPPASQSPPQPTSPQPTPQNPQEHPPIQATIPDPGQTPSAPSAEAASSDQATLLSASTDTPSQQGMPPWLQQKIESTRRRPQTGMEAQLPAAQDLARAMVNKQRMAEQQFHLVVIPEDGTPRKETFGNVEQLIERMQTLMQTDVYLFPFMGNHLRITKGPHRYLETPYGALPLFVVPDPGDVDYEEDGFVGKERIELQEPQTPEEGVEDEEEEAFTAPAAIAPPDDTPVLPDA